MANNTLKKEFAPSHNPTPNAVPKKLVQQVSGARSFGNKLYQESPTVMLSSGTLTPPT